MVLGKSCASLGLARKGVGKVGRASLGMGPAKFATQPRWAPQLGTADGAGWPSCARVDGAERGAGGGARHARRCWVPPSKKARPRRKQQNRAFGAPPRATGDRSALPRVSGRGSATRAMREAKRAVACVAYLWRGGGANEEMCALV